MIAELETKELERQCKEEEEKRPSETVKHDNVGQIEIDKSKDRVYEHFKHVSQSPSEEVNLSQVNTPKKNKKKKKNKKHGVILSRMAGTKRKRESDIAREDAGQQTTSDNNFCTSVPSLNTRIIHTSKKRKQEIQRTIEERKVQENIAQVKGNQNQPKSMR